MSWIHHLPTGCFADVNPGRNLPRALFGGVLVVTGGFYVQVKPAYPFVLPLDALASSTLPAADAMVASGSISAPPAKTRRVSTPPIQ